MHFSLIVHLNTKIFMHFFCTKFNFLWVYLYRKPKPLDTDILRSMKMQHNVGYAKNLGKEKRNQIPYVQVNEKSKKGKGSVPESPIGRGRSQDVTFYAPLEKGGILFCNCLSVGRSVGL